MERRLSRRKRWIFSAALGLGMLLLQEALFRFVFPTPEIVNFNRGAYSALLPGFHGPSPVLAHASFRWTSEPDGATFVHSLNLYGFRDPVTWPVEKGTRRRVMFIGDSFVEGDMTTDEETIPEAYARSGMPEGHPVEVLNMGMTGTGLAHYLPLIRDAVPLFKPDLVLLILYANDLPPPAFRPKRMASPLEPLRANPWQPRAFSVVHQALRGDVVPRLWHTKPFPFFPPVPDPTNPLSDRGVRLEHNLDPSLLSAMKRGTLNPYLVFHLAACERALRADIDVSAYLQWLPAFFAGRGTALRIAYVPHSVQVSDYYLAFARRYSVRKDLGPFTGPEYQVQAAALAKACARVGIPFLDLTPPMRELEERGQHLYWDYDNHLRGNGYAWVAERLHEWSKQ